MFGDTMQLIDADESKILFNYTINNNTVTSLGND